MGIYDSDTIQNLKSRIESKCHILSSQQLLLLQKQTLWHDHRTLRQYRIHDGAIIILKVYNELKIKKLRQQYIFRKSIDKAYKALEIERSTTDISESDLRSEIDAKYLYELAYQEEIEWQNLDEWMSKKLRKYLYEIQERSIKEKSLIYKRAQKRGRSTTNPNLNIKESSQTQSSHNWDSLPSTSKPSKPPRVNSMSTIEEVKESKSEKSSQKSPSRSKSKSPDNNNNNNKNKSDEENKYDDIDDIKYGGNNNKNNFNNNNSNNINFIGNTFKINIAPSERTRKHHTRDPYKYQSTSHTLDYERNKYDHPHHHHRTIKNKGRIGRTRAFSTTTSRDKELTYRHKHRESKHVEFLDFPSTTEHKYRQFMYKDCLFCCHDGTRNVKIYIAIFFIFALLLSAGSYFTYDQHKRLEELSRDHYTNSTCHVYNDSYAVWVAYDEFNGRVDCRDKTRKELEVNDWHGDIENIPYPNNNNHDSSTNKYIYDNNNFTSTFAENYNYIEYHCYVTKDCSLIAISTKGESDLENPYTWDSSVIYVLTVFIWICCGLCLLTAIYLHFGYIFKRKKFLKTEWIETPPHCKCQYFVKYTRRKLEMEEKIPTKVLALIYKYYYYQEMEPSKSSKSVASTQIIYSEKSKSKSKSNPRNLQRPRRQTVTVSATDKTASSDDKTASRESKSL